MELCRTAKIRPCQCVSPVAGLKGVNLGIEYLTVRELPLRSALKELESEVIFFVRLCAVLGTISL